MAKTKTAKSTNGAAKPRKKKLKYDCLKCPGYCCSYPVIEVKDRDAERTRSFYVDTLGLQNIYPGSFFLALNDGSYDATVAFVRLTYHW